MHISYNCVWLEKIQQTPFSSKHNYEMNALGLFIHQNIGNFTVQTEI